MQRIQLTPRPDWQKKVEKTGLTFHSRTEPYWTEDACYAFDSEQIDTIEEAAGKVHELCKAAADHIIDQNLFEQMGIPCDSADLAIKSWRSREPALYGRFDFAYDGRGQPKLLEYNADTPTSLLEAAVTQWYWLEERFQDKGKPAGIDQFNSLHESLVDRWKQMGIRGRIHFTTFEEAEEDVMTIEYLRDTAAQAGLETKGLGIGDIGFHHPSQRLVDLENQEISTMFKLYPWEWLMREGAGHYIPSARTRLIEPAWKMMWSNKAILPILWEIAPGHPNLLPAYYEAGKIEGGFVKKPRLGREGANILVNVDGRTQTSGGNYGSEGYVYQQYFPIPKFDAKTPVLGVWMIGDECHGMGIRESEGAITTNTSRFVPHYFRRG